MPARRTCHLLYPILLLTLAIPAKAQYTITGMVENVKGLAITDAVVIAQNEPGSTVLRTALADEDGHYSIIVPAPGSLVIKASATGFEDGTALLAASQNGDTTISFTLLKKTGKLSEVTVSALKPLLERKIDRTIFNVSASIAAVGGDALEAVKKSPGVIVKESDHTIMLAGKSGAQILINGRLLELSGEDLTAYLQSIPSENIDRIEVITTPPAQYDAAGNAGLINIVLKKNRMTGFNGNVRLGYEQSTYGTGITGGAVNYRKGKLSIYSNASYANGAKGNVERLNTYYTDQVYQLADPYKKQTKDLQYTAGTDYELSKKSVLGMQYSDNTFSRHDNIGDNIFVINRSTAATDSVIHTTGTSLANRHTATLNLNYVLTIDSAGKKLSINANRLWFNSDRYRAYRSDNYYGLFQSPTGITDQDKNIGKQDVVITTAQADMELPYKWAAISCGGKLSFVENNSSIDFQYFANGAFHSDPGISNAFIYREAVQALYLSARKDLGKWSFQAGLRAEATQTSGYSRNLNQTSLNSYLNLFPNAYAAYKKDETHILDLNYSKRINRPGYAELNPFRLYASPYFYQEGNPFLKPSYSHNLELNYTLQQKYTISAYYQTEQAHFGEIFFADSVTKTGSGEFANFGDAHAYGISASASWKPLRWWEVQLLANGGVQQISTNEAANGVRQSYGLPNIYCSASNGIALNKSKTLMAEVNAYYLSRYQQDLFYYNGVGSVDTGIKAVLLDKKLVVSLNATDVFRTQLSRGTNQSTGQTLNSYFDQRNLRLMLNYKFGSDKVKAQRERSTGLEDEKGRT